MLGREGQRSFSPCQRPHFLHFTLLFSRGKLPAGKERLGLRHPFEFPGRRSCISTAKDCSYCNDDWAKTVCSCILRLSGLINLIYQNFCASSGRISLHSYSKRLNSSLNFVMSYPHFNVSSLAISRAFMAPYSDLSRAMISSKLNDRHPVWLDNQTNALPLINGTNLGIRSDSFMSETFMKNSILVRNASREPVPSKLGQAFASNVIGGLALGCLRLGTRVRADPCPGISDFAGKLVAWITVWDASG